MDEVTQKLTATGNYIVCRMPRHRHYLEDLLAQMEASDRKKRNCTIELVLGLAMVALCLVDAWQSAQIGTLWGRACTVIDLVIAAGVFWWW